MTLRDVTVMFGIGAPKAGTTWLHRYLLSHPDCHFPARKEAHYFDRLEGVVGTPELQARAERARSLQERINVIERRWSRRARNDWVPDPERLARLAEMYGRMHELRYWLALEQGQSGDHAAYLDYLADGHGNARVIGDVTPAYSMLEGEVFGVMATLAADVRFIYLLRDPVDRLWSHVRMLARRVADAGAGFAETARALMDRFLEEGDDGLSARSDYRGTIARLFAHVPARNVHLEFFERLFTQEAADRITAFLGLSPLPAPIDRRVHAGIPLALDDERRARARALLAPQYAFAGEFFGDRLPPEWRAQMVEV